MVVSIYFFVLVNKKQNYITRILGFIGLLLSLSLSLSLSWFGATIPLSKWEQVVSFDAGLVCSAEDASSIRVYHTGVCSNFIARMFDQRLPGRRYLDQLTDQIPDRVLISDKASIKFKNEFLSLIEKIKRYVISSDQQQGLAHSNFTYLDSAVGVKLRKRSLRFADFKNVDMPYIHIKETELQGARFINSKFYKADLRKNNIQGAVFRKTVLAYSKVVGSEDSNNKECQNFEAEYSENDSCNIKIAMDGVELRKAILFEVDFENVELEGIIFNDNKLKNVEFIGVDFEGVDFMNSKFTGTQFIKNNLSFVKFDNIIGEDGNLGKVNVSHNCLSLNSSSNKQMLDCDTSEMSSDEEVYLWYKKRAKHLCQLRKDDALTLGFKSSILNYLLTSSKVCPIPISIGREWQQKKQYKQIRILKNYIQLLPLKHQNYCESSSCEPIFERLKNRIEHEIMSMD